MRKCLAQYSNDALFLTVGYLPMYNVGRSLG